MCRQSPTCTMSACSPKQGAALAAPIAVAAFALGIAADDLVQAPAFSPTQHDLSDLGATAASSPWLYNQLAANTAGALLVLFAVVLFRAMGASRPGRLAAVALT